MKFKNSLILVSSIIVFFLIGLFYDMQYRILTRTIVYKLSNYNLDYYGGKEFRFFVPDLGFILTLVPLGLFFTIKHLKSKKTGFISVLAFIVFLLLFYLIFCFLESQIIKYTTVIDSKGIYHYHYSNLNYRLIAFFSIVFSLSTNFLIFKILKKQGNSISE